MSTIPGEVVHSHSQRLFQNLQAGFWDRPEWRSFKQKVEILARSFQKYCDYLNAKKQRTFANHHSPQQICSIENSLTVQFVQQRHTVASLLQPLCTSIADAGLDSPVFLQDAGVLPDDRRRRYDYMESVKGGLDVPIILVTYSAGGTHGNLHWAWNTSADNISSALQSCQPIIERIKQEIPQFHTREMRKVAFEKYGLITSSVKKAVL